MSGPGGPATARTVMTPPSNVGAAQNMLRVKTNIQKMLDQSAPEADIDDYLAHEGVTVEQLRNSPVAGPGQVNASTPVASAYNPTPAQRIADQFAAKKTGTRPAALPNNASVATRAIDWLNTIGSAGDTMARGITGGLSDEAAALGSATGAVLPGSANPGKFGETFAQADRAENQNIANFHEDHPVAGAALETLGLVASPLMRVGGEFQQAGRTLLSRAGRAALTGAGQGALTGAAYSDGGTGDRLTAALLGAGLGGTIGGVMAPTLEVGTRGVQTFMDTLNARRQAAADPAARARQMIATAISRDAMTPIPQQGEALASAGGPNVQGLARQSTVAPGNARAVAADYYAGAAADAPDVIGQATQRNVSGNRLQPTLEALDRQQRAASGPAYDAFYALSPDAFDTPYFRNLMGGSVGRDLIQEAYRLGEIERAAGHIPDNPMQYLLDAQGNPTLNQAPTARAVDLMKRAIDQRVSENTDAFGRVRGAAGNSWERLRRSFITNADRASTVDGVSLFGQARAAYAGPQQLKDAANLGSQAFNIKGLTSQKAQTFTDLSPSEQEAFRTGLAEAVIEKAGQMGPNTDPVNLFLKGRNANQLMRLYLGNQGAFDDFVQTLQQQSRIVKSARTVMGGSATAPRLAENADAAAQEEALTNQLTMARDAWNLATGRGGGRVSAAVNLANRARNSATGVSEPVANELGRMLFNPNAAANQGTVRNLSVSLIPQANALTLHQQALQRLLGSYATLPAAPVGAAMGSY